jgi:hypothetical protein
MESAAIKLSTWELMKRWITRITAPDRWLRDRLAEVKVQLPKVDFDAMDERLPWWEYQAFARSIAPPPFNPSPDDPLPQFGAFVECDDEFSDRRTLDVRDLYGISASASHIVPLSALSRTWSVNDILAKRQDVEGLVREVLHGTYDCVAKDGQPVRVVEQEWDGRLYVANSGGSHRFAAIWRWHHEQKQPLMLDCTISKARLSPATLDAVARNRYWLLAVEAPWNLRLLLNLAGDQSLIADAQGRDSGITVRDLGYGECCVAYPRLHPQASVLDDWLVDGFALDLSATVLRLARRP